MKTSPIMSQICQSRFSILSNKKWTVKNLPKTCTFLPKWRNFDKSGHTDSGVCMYHRTDGLWLDVSGYTTILKQSALFQDSYARIYLFARIPTSSTANPSYTISTFLLVDRSMWLPNVVAPNSQSTIVEICLKAYVRFHRRLGHPLRPVAVPKRRQESLFEVVQPESGKVAACGRVQPRAPVWWWMWKCRNGLGSSENIEKRYFFVYQNCKLRELVRDKNVSL